MTSKGFKLRGYQLDAKNAISALWQNAVRFVLLVLPTGGGKTITFSDITADNVGPVCVIAHRQELVLQMSMALARERIKHNIIGANDTVKLASKQHLTELGSSFFDPRASVTVASVDTLKARINSLKTWAATITLWVIDEAHHVLRANKWGEAALLFPNARGLGVERGVPNKNSMIKAARICIGCWPLIQKTYVPGEHWDFSL